MSHPPETSLSSRDKVNHAEEECRAYSGSEIIAREFVYTIHSWRGRSPEFMQTQVNKLSERIDAWVRVREEKIIQSAADIADEWHRPAYPAGNPSLRQAILTLATARKPREEKLEGQ